MLQTSDQKHSEERGRSKSVYATTVVVVFLWPKTSIQEVVAFPGMILSCPAWLPNVQKNNAWFALAMGFGVCFGERKNGATIEQGLILNRNGRYSTWNHKKLNFVVRFTGKKYHATRALIDFSFTANVMIKAEESWPDRYVSIMLQRLKPYENDLLKHVVREIEALS